MIGGKGFIEFELQVSIRCRVVGEAYLWLQRRVAFICNLQRVISRPFLIPATSPGVNFAEYSPLRVTSMIAVLEVLFRFSVKSMVRISKAYTPARILGFSGRSTEIFMPVFFFRSDANSPVFVCKPEPIGIYAFDTRKETHGSD